MATASEDPTTVTNFVSRSTSTPTTPGTRPTSCFIAAAQCPHVIPGTEIVNIGAFMSPTLPPVLPFVVIGGGSVARARTALRCTR